MKFEICSDSLSHCVRLLRPGMRLVVNGMSVMRFERGYGVDSGRVQYYDSATLLMVDLQSDNIGKSACSREEIFPES